MRSCFLFPCYSRYWHWSGQTQWYVAFVDLIHLNDLIFSNLCLFSYWTTMDKLRFTDWSEVNRMQLQFSNRGRWFGKMRPQTSSKRHKQRQIERFVFFCWTTTDKLEFTDCSESEVQRRFGSVEIAIFRHRMMIAAPGLFWFSPWRDQWGPISVNFDHRGLIGSFSIWSINNIHWHHGGP